MNKIEIKPLKDPLNVQLELPGSLTYTIRALIIASMTKGSVKIENALKSDDTRGLFSALQELNIRSEETSSSYIIHGDISDVKDQEYTIDIGLSGRSARMILPLLCMVSGIKNLTCSEEFKKRPIKDLVDGLTHMGAEIEYLDQENCLPLRVMSNKLNPGTVQMRGDISSQYFSAIMMVSPLVGNVEIEVIGTQTSRSFIDVTIDILRDFGIEVINSEYSKYLIKPGQHFINPGLYMVETDATSAGYFFGIAALTKSKIRILNLSPGSKQGDIKFIDLLTQMGCIVTVDIDEKWIEIQGPEILNCIEADMNTLPDSVPTITVLSSFARGRSHISGLNNLKLKESDRIEAPKIELGKMGIKAETTNDSLIIYGSSPQGTAIDTHGDHRIAMAFAVAGTKIPGIVINNADVVSKSFPGFWDKLEEIGVTLERKNIL